MKTSRQRLLEYLEKTRFATAAELSRALQVSSANIRHHLAILLSEGAVQVVGTTPHTGRGRPPQVYGTAKAAGNNLGGLASALLEQLGGPDSERAELALQQVASRLANSSGLPHSPSQRLLLAVQKLNAMYYQARWEAHADSPRLILGHCPYAAILNEHPELCNMDAALLKNMLLAPVQQTAKLEPGLHGVPQCVLKIIDRQA